MSDSYGSVTSAPAALIILAASFNASPTHSGAPITVSFNDTSTGTITNRFWSFGDGSTTNADSCATCEFDNDGPDNLAEYLADTNGWSSIYTNLPPTSVTNLLLDADAAAGTDTFYRIEAWR